MYLAYSAIQNVNNNQQQNNPNEPANEQMLRYKGYQMACDKFSREIAAIQQYLPGWMPKFR